ncbi:MAG: hypothetical protein K9J37_07400 [Saprospiraceae bacterium]|nr:hypothetical protein [Saprospiraceae bacterium]MCF8249723.1 hypothetical protein [Saprospiraceae bacterium]MCF8282509.1 hypothetical protein [Bacteroidales bacterium]MCF8314094.1 hypothetical protein [Saprospiraceae bacterium]MCF8442839.1 hypothetical protein [Saprospiraceae bacterium]
MTIYTLLLYVGIAAAVLTALTGFIFKAQKSWLMTYLQHFCGSLFLFSGYVKAVDPLGTAFKMEQYFAEFFYTFDETNAKFIAPMFPWLSSHSILVSNAMIVFEIALGIMLVLAWKPKLTSWLFFLLVAFFTVLTGYTYLTGYVPSGVNFFEFGQWGAYVKTNMRVTDCGCFGDFLKLKPKVSFMKDIFLLVPSLYFIFKHKNMHELFTAKVRGWLVLVVTLGFSAFCYYNTYLNEPVIDFRPFRAGVDVRAQREIEAAEEAAAYKVLAYRMKSKSSGQVVTVPYEQYMKEYEKYPSEEWEMEQIKVNADYEHSKVSEFEITAPDGSNMTDALLQDTGYFLMVVAYKLMESGSETKTTMVNDTIFVTDTVRVVGGDSDQLVKRVDSVTPREVKQTFVNFDPAYMERFTNVVNPVINAAKGTGVKFFAATAPNDPAVISRFKELTASNYPFFTADDLLLKTIQRSNPGIVLWKDGKILAKWHYKDMASFEQMKEKYIKLTPSK